MNQITPSSCWSDDQLAVAVRASWNWRMVMRELGLKSTSAGAIRIVRRRAEQLGLDASHFRGMDNRLAPKYTWSDEQLSEAVQTSPHWRGVMRALGIQTNSASVLRRLRRDVARLELDVSHFRGSRIWSDADLLRAVDKAITWDDVLSALGLGTPEKATRLRIQRHAARLGLDLSHLESAPLHPEPSTLRPDLRHLREAAPTMAAAWFTLRGCTASFPIEPAAFDLVVSAPDGVKHVQVKTSTTRSRNTWIVRIGRRPHSAGNQAPLTMYDPDEIDLYFIVDGDLSIYLIPSRDIAGRTSILVRAYQRYLIGNVKEMMTRTLVPGAAA